MPAVDWSNYEVVDDTPTNSNVDWGNYELVPDKPKEEDKTLHSQVEALMPQVAADEGISLEKQREGLSPSENELVNSVFKDELVKEATRRAKQSPAMGALEGVRNTVAGLGKALQSPENIGLGVLAAAAPQVAFPILAGIAAKQAGESAGKLSVPGGSVREAIPEILNPVLQVLGTKAVAREASLAKTAEATKPANIADLEKNYEIVPESEVSKVTEEAKAAPVPKAQEEVSPPSTTLTEPEAAQIEEPVAPNTPENQVIEFHGGPTPIALLETQKKLGNSWSTGENKATIARLKDAADNQARVFGDQQGTSVAVDARSLFGNKAQEALNAIDPVIESGGDISKLDTFLKQSQGKSQEAYDAAQFAKDNWNALQPLAAKVRDIHNKQIAAENAAGINTTFRENYIKHAFDISKLPGRGEEFFGSSGGTGRKSGFKAERKFDTIYDAIDAGYGKAVQTLDASKLVKSRVTNGQQLINDRSWVNGFRSVADPTTGKPLVSDITYDANHYPHAPSGYDPVQVLPGQFVAVHNGYQKIFKAVTGESKLTEFEVHGLPVLEAALKTEAAIKHGLLLIDTFHASRVMQKQFFLTGKVGWNKGLSILQYTDADLATALKNAEITKSMVDYAKANRPTADLFLQRGLNVGQIADALRNDVVRNIPGVGTFTKWVFDKVTRGAMLQSALTEFPRVKAANPKLTDMQVVDKIVPDINATFGNLGRQGLLKSRTMQDIARLAFLAPQWVEAMARSEIGGAKQIARVPYDAIVNKTLKVGTLGKAMAQGLLAYVVGTQLLNLVTRKQFTWQNKEDDHKLDAWIPDVTGKTPGFFLSPLSVVAELTHDAYRFAFKKDNALDIANQIIQNKLSPFGRAANVMWTGKNFMGEKIDGAWNRIKDAAIAIAPTPLPLQAAVSNKPGQAQRQAFGMAGLKIEPAPTPLQQISAKARDFMKASGKAPETDTVYHEGSPHSELRKALINKDDAAVAKAIKELRKTNNDESIERGQEEVVQRRFTGSNQMEQKFKRSLTPEEKQVYEDAIKQKREQHQHFLKAWRKRNQKEE